MHGLLIRCVERTPNIAQDERPWHWTVTRTVPGLIVNTFGFGCGGGGGGGGGGEGKWWA